MEIKIETLERDKTYQCEKIDSFLKAERTSNLEIENLKTANQCLKEEK